MSEFDFWEMTLAELERLFRSKRRMKKEQEKERAQFDYILANLIGISVSRVHNKSNKMPEIEKVYPNLFDAERVQAKRKAAQFKKFAQALNKKFEEGGDK